MPLSKYDDGPMDHNASQNSQSNSSVIEQTLDDIFGSIAPIGFSLAYLIYRAQIAAEENSVSSTLAPYPKKNINETQKNVIEGTFYYIFLDIEKLTSSDRMKALKAITAKDMSSAKINYFKAKDVRDSIVQAREILFHDHPEQLLNLTSRNDINTEVEKSGVVDYVHELIKKE